MSDLELGFDIGSTHREPEITVVEDSTQELVQVQLVVEGQTTASYAIHPAMWTTVRHILEGMCGERAIGHVDWQGKWVQG
jgi:hypothetical protein